MQPNALEVDLDAIAHNVAQLRHRTGEGVTFVGAVKGNAYGHGLERVAPALLEAGVDMLALVRLDHAVGLRAAGITAPILLYAGVHPSPDVVETIAANDLMVTVVDEGQAHAYAAASRPIRALVKVDVGLERLGSAPEPAVGVARAVAAAPRLELAGVYTHLHVPSGTVADIAPYVASQFERFSWVIGELEAGGVRVSMRMAVSSGSLRLSDAMTLNAIDVGSLLYGLDPPGPTDRDLGLRPAMVRLVSHLAQVRDVRRDHHPTMSPIPVGRDLRLGVMPFGTVDGLVGISVGHVLVGGRRAPTMGISMEHTRIDLTGIDAAAGDEVVIVGRQGDEEISIGEVAAANRLHSPAFVPVLVGHDVPRRYLGGR